MNLGDVDALPVTVDLMVAARAIGIGRTRAYGSQSVSLAT